MTKTSIAMLAGATALAAGMAAAACTGSQAQAAPSYDQMQVKRGEYLVTIGGCNDCHTPLKMGPKGPEPDMTRMLSGHPEQLVITEPARLPPGPWMIASAPTNTAHSGPWGVSFTANLTPDKETGLGAWTADQFVTAIRTGRHLGKGRPILPPMPWPVYRNLTDDDLKSVFAYLQTLKPIRNKVPEPIEPAEGGR